MSNAIYDEPAQVAEWRAKRTKGIGSSDAAAVAGLDPYKSALDVYLDKVGEREPTGRLPTEPAMRWGLLLEPAIAKAYTLDTGIELRKAKHKSHPVHEFMGCTPDYLGDEPNTRNEFIVELKAASLHMAKAWGEPGSDFIPERTILQVHHQMAVYDLDRADVAVLIAGSDFRIYTVRRMESVVNDLIEMESEFWNEHVLKRIPPEPDWTNARTPELIAKMYPPTAGIEVSMSELLPRVQEYHKCKQLSSEAAKAADSIKAEIIYAMKDAATAHVEGWKVSRKQVTRKSYTVAETTYSDFRISPPKGLKVNDE